MTFGPGPSPFPANVGKCSSHSLRVQMPVFHRRTGLMHIGTFALLERSAIRARLPLMREQAVRLAATEEGETTSRPQRLFYRVLLPIGILANLGLGVLLLFQIPPTAWTDRLQIGTGAFCCLVAGWLSASLWSKVYWNRSMARQVALWKQIADTVFTWVEESPLPAEAVRRLQSSLDRVVPSSPRN